MISADVAIFLRDLLSRQKLDASAPDLVAVAVLVEKAQEQLSAVIAAQDESPES